MSIGSIRLEEIVSRFGGELRGENLEVSACSSIDAASAGAITFLSSAKYKKLLQHSNAGAVIVKAGDVDGLNIPCIVCRDPQLYFARVLKLFHPSPVAVPGIHPSAVVSENAFVDPSCQIGPHVVIESGAVIQEKCIIDAGVVIGANVHIAAGTHIYPRVVIYGNCIIGERVIIHSGAIIGADGFGNAWAGTHWEKIPQIGRVIVGDDVEIGANTTVDRGAASDTVIKSGARIDNLVQIAHNVVIGDHTAIAACTGIAGSTHIGANCLIGGGANISGHLTIVDKVTLLGGSGVGSDIKEPGVYASGLPAINHSSWLRNTVHWRHFDDLAKRIKMLEKKFSIIGNAGSNQE